MLRRVKTAQKEAQLAIGTGWGNKLNLVFTQPDGQPCDPASVSGRFKWLVANVPDLPRIRLHDLRHPHASHLLHAGESPLVLSRRLDHSNAGFTLSVYGHVLPGDDSSAASAAASLVDGAC